MATVMVELHNGYGDGYGVVEITDEGRVAVNPARKVKQYHDGTPMEAWKQKLLSAASVSLLDGGVRVPSGAIRRVIGPVDCAEACRIRMRRYTRNWGDAGFVALATDDEVVAAMSQASEPETHKACNALAKKYAV